MRASLDAGSKPDSSWSVGSEHGCPDEGLHQTFAKTALMAPDAVALIFQKHRITYSVLNRVADSWASSLSRAGVAKGKLVPILLPRSVELVAALLAVLKTGAAYSLLDERWPPRCLRELVCELDAPVVICREGHQPALPAPTWSPPDFKSSPLAEHEAVEVVGGDPCCVFFTSGTSGRPKGVLTTHRATARLFKTGGFARFGPDTVMPLAAPASWDAFSLELWSVLLNGGASLIVDEPYLTADELRRGVAAHKVDTLWLTSSLFNLIVDEDPAAFDGARRVITGGERLSVSHVDRFLRQHPDIVLINGYGPVESVIFAATRRVTPADCERSAGVPLGCPTPGTQIFVLDGSRTCCVGETGEIWVGGDGLALGYLGDSELTATKFVRVSIEGVTRRLFRTGDLGFWSEDGLLNFQGRKDRQIKVSGRRVEPVEVERQIESLLPEVRSCRVVARAGKDGRPAGLVAFCRPSSPGDSLGGAMRTLKAGLMSHHQPEAVVSVEEFPLTASGKLDERALLSLVPVATVGAASSTIPCDDLTTAIVAQMFGEALGHADISIETDFFESGGQSLEAGRICARLARRLGRPVPVSWLYRDSTVKALAERLRASNGSGSVSAGATSACEAPLTSIQLVFLTRHLADPSDRTSHCVLAWRIDGRVDLEALRSAVEWVHDRHEALRAAYVPGPRPVARLIDVPSPPLEILGARSNVDEATRALRREFAAELQPMEGDVWRALLVPIAEASVHVFGCVVHHLAFDGWSEAVLAKDLSRAYNAFLEGVDLALPPAPSLRQVSEERAAFFGGVDLGAQKASVRRELMGAPNIRWPRRGADGGPNDVRRIEWALSSDVVERIDKAAADAGVRRFVLLISHYARSLTEVTGQPDVSVGVPIRQRFSSGLEEAVGCHMNVVCLRFRGTAVEDGRAALSEAAEVVRRAFAAQDLDLGDVLDLIKPPRSDRPPLFQTLFALQDNPAPSLELSGARSVFLRQPYLDLPLELHTELWPEADGGLRVEVLFKPKAVSDVVGRNLACRYHDRLTHIGV